MVKKHLKPIKEKIYDIRDSIRYDIAKYDIRKYYIVSDNYANFWGNTFINIKSVIYQGIKKYKRSIDD